MSDPMLPQEIADNATSEFCCADVRVLVDEDTMASALYIGSEPIMGMSPLALERMANALSRANNFVNQED